MVNRKKTTHTPHKQKIDRSELHYNWGELKCSERVTELVNSYVDNFTKAYVTLADFGYPV